MSDPHLQHLGMHANHLSRHTNSEKMQGILQWVGVGSVIMMGLGASVHLFRDLWKPHPEPFCKHKYRETMDEMDRQDRGHKSHAR